jgi:hypothetical protein
MPNEYDPDIDDDATPPPDPRFALQRGGSTSPTAKLHELTVEEQLKSAVSIDPLLIQEEYVRLPADLAYWNERYVQAYRAQGTAKSRKERLFALLSLQTRQRLVDEGLKPTESMVTAHVEGDKSYIAVADSFFAAEVELVRIKGVVEAVRAKKDMLVSVGAHIRAELNSDPSLRSESRSARQHDAGRRGEG